jgi:hypothetical protein
MPFRIRRPAQGGEAVAKRKSTNSKPQTASPSKTNRVPSRAGTPSAPATETPSKGQPELSPIAIGHAAGEIWGLLSSNGEQTLAAVKKSIDAPADTVLAAIGWLAREDKLDFATTGRTVKISLR